eukprot:CAMPEP_0195285788 /NCGR_PEP_ID=MMETSP0707-20130614/3498_1 /TAXON_ID=33640 /ORGANISM="Asterionellopsis glacialis, Strain CCMP134" /LENGTH=402 /DNA_ID=CAMNT_0040345337 /DNA_START=29 /DNA_END=1237 /DNA_ORIENTATION=-
MSRIGDDHTNAANISALLVMPVTKKQKLSPPAKVRDEIRRTISVVCLASLYEKGCLKRDQQLKWMFELFHGKKETKTVSYIEQFLQGEGLFKGCYDSEKAFLSKKYLRIDTPLEVSAEDLEFKSYTSRIVISGRALHDAAKLCLKNMKKAASCAASYLDDAGNPKESGKTQVDVCEQVLDDMWALVEDNTVVISNEKTNNNASSDTGNDSASALDTETDSEGESNGGLKSTTKSCDAVGTRPRNWYFHGYMAFVLFGPFKENRDNDRFLDFLLKDDPPEQDKKKYSRSSSRTATVKQEKFLREIDSNRGKSTLDIMLQKTQEHQEKMANQAGLEATLMSLNLRADRIQREMSTTIVAAAHSPAASARYEKLVEQLDKINVEIEAMEKHMKATMLLNEKKSSE